MFDRDTYYQTCIEQGLDHDEAERVADGIMAAKKRQADAAANGTRGWETLAGHAPSAVRRRAEQLFVLSDKSNPDRDGGARLAANVQSVFAFGMLAGMLARRQGLRVTDAELHASRVNLPELWEWLCREPGGEVQCPHCGHFSDGPYPWWDGEGKCPKCQSKPPAEQWRRGVLHENGWEGDEGLIMLLDGESPEDCIRRHELSVDAKWREVRARRAIARPSKIMGSHAETLTELYEEFLSEGGEDEWNAQYGEQLVFPESGGDQALDAMLDAWAAKYLELRAWVIHPEDKEVPK